MRWILLAVAAVGVLAVGSAAQAGPPVQFAGWDHHHHGPVVDYRYRPQYRYYSPAVVYPPVYAPAYPQCYAPPQAVGTYYNPGYYPDNYVSFYGRNFGVRVGF